MGGKNSFARSHLLLLSTIALGMFLDGLDGTIVNVALPDIADSFNMGPSMSSWIVTIYFLVLAGLVLIFGKLCDSGAIKKIAISGFVVFSLASLACGLSYDIAALLAFRAVQGVGASMLAASSIMLGVKFLPSNMTSFGLGVGLLGSSVGAALGPALGGVLAEMLSWHWIFFINVPIGLVAAVIARKALPVDTGFDRSAFDYRGSVLLFLSLVFGLYALESFPSHGVTTTAVGSVILFVILFSAFLFYERRQTVQVLRLRLFRSRRFLAVTLSFLILNACYMGCLYLLPYYMRVELGFDTISCGLMLLVAAVVTLILCLKVGKKADLIGNRPFVIAGCAVMVVALIVFVLMDAQVPLWVMVVGLALLGTVWGVAGGPIGSRLIDNVPKDEKGSGSSVLSFFIYFGSALGTALFAGLFGFGSSSAGQSMADLDPAVFMDGFTFAMAVAVVLAVIGLISAVAVNESKVEG